MSLDPALDVAVVGAGLSGLSAARRLAASGQRVRVFDKGGAPGGRSSTRRAAGLRLDHGAQYFTVRDARLQQQVASWAEAGVVREWPARIVRLGPGNQLREAGGNPRYVGVPGMGAIAAHLAHGLALGTPCRVAQITSDRAEAGYRLSDAEGRDLGRFDAVLVTTPPAQAAPLLQRLAPDLAARAAGVEMLPCWTAMVAFDQVLEAGFDAAFVVGGPLAWIASQASKPGRPATEAWVLHAGPDWSARTFDWPAERVIAALVEAFLLRVDRRDRRPSWQSAHRWRYARPRQALGEPCLWDADRRLGLAGDWCIEGRVEAAILSGTALAEALLDTA